MIILFVFLFPIVSALSTTTWSNGNSSLSLNFDGVNSQTYYLLLGKTAEAINISFNSTGWYQSGVESFVTYHGDNVTTYSGYWRVATGSVLNPENSNDGSFTTYSTIGNGPAQVNASYLLNFSYYTTLYDANVTIIKNAASEATVYCKNYTYINESSNILYNFENGTTDMWSTDASVSVVNEECGSLCLPSSTRWINISGNAKAAFNLNQNYSANNTNFTVYVQSDGTNGQLVCFEGVNASGPIACQGIGGVQYVMAGNQWLTIPNSKLVGTGHRAYITVMPYFTNSTTQYFFNGTYATTDVFKNASIENVSYIHFKAITGNLITDNIRLGVNVTSFFDGYEWQHIGITTATTEYIVDIPDNCILDNVSQIQLNLTYGSPGGGQLLYEVYLNGTRISEYYPYNYSVFYDGVLAFNNASLLDGKTLVSFSGNQSTGLFKNITFFTNTPSRINITDLYVEWNSNHSVQVYSEWTDSIYQASYVKANRIINNITWDSDYTTTGIYSLGVLNYSGIVDIQYYDNASSFPLRHFYYYNQPYTTQNQTLYVINNTNVSDVLVTLYDEFGSPLEGYYLGIDKYLPDYNKYITVEMHKTDFNGQSLAHLETLDKIYRFNIYDTNLSLIKTTGSTDIKSTSLGITVNFGEDVWTSLEYIDEIGYSLTYNNDTKQFILVYVDNNNIIDILQFLTTRRTLFGSSTICNNVTSVQSGTLYCTINPNQSGVFYSQVFVETTANNSPYFATGLEYQYTDVPDKMGTEGILATAFMIIALVGVGLFSPVLVIILSVVGLIFATIMGIIYLQIGTLVTLLIIGGIFVFKMRA